MEERRKILLNEIRQIVEQYKVEVPGKRRAWPKSVKTRAMELVSTGINYHEVSKLTGIAYHTILSWREKPVSVPIFKELTISEKPKSQIEPRVPTVTVGKKRKYTKSNLVMTVTVGNVAISGLDMPGVLRVLKELGVGHGA